VRLQVRPISFFIPLLVALVTGAVAEQGCPHETVTFEVRGMVRAASGAT
jgi:hypothetical protein